MPPGLRHVAITVRDLDASATWYRTLFDLEAVLQEDFGDRRTIVFRLADGQVFGLVEHNANAGEVFQPHRTGLDHVAFKAESREEMEAWVARLDERGIAHSGVIEIPGVGILNFKDPDGIALSFYWDREDAD